MYTPLWEFFKYMNINIFKNNAILSEKSRLISSIFAGILIAFCLLGIIMPKATDADYTSKIDASYVAKEAIKKIKVVVTAYSSTPDQTDSTPFITASGKYVRDGIIANNMLPFGTKVRIPSLYGDKVFTVEDRMNRKKSNYHFDIWFPDRISAINFGVKTVEMEVLES